MYCHAHITTAQQFHERESHEEMVRKLEQQHQDAERHLRANSQAVLLLKEEELKQVNEKLHNVSQEIEKLQVSVYIHVVEGMYRW